MIEVGAIMKKLNLGCGRFKKEGYVNVDWDPNCKPDIVLNLVNLPYPLPDNEYDLIELDHVLEHLPSPFETMRELHRICKDGGRVIIRVPHFSRALTHSEHKCGFDVAFPFYFSPEWIGGYTGTHFELESMRLTWSAQPYLKKKILSPVAYGVATLAGCVIDFFANLSPMVCSRLWCFYVGGFEQIEYAFICRK